MKKYKKLAVAVIGALLLAGSDIFGIDLPFTADSIYNTVVAIATAVGVWGVSNDA